MLNIQPNYKNEFSGVKSLIIASKDFVPLLNDRQIKTKTINLSAEGYVIFSEKIQDKECLFIIGDDPSGTVYGTFHFLRLLQMNESLENINISESPKIKYRILNHWDNLDRTVERGYAGFSIWEWHKLPDYISQRYIDYARANASIGINGTVLTNVNANSLVLSAEYLKKVKKMADIFRPYGIKVFLTARFSSPIELGGLKTADPLDSEVVKWWNNKVDEIYDLIPDFGGLLVKANSEGQPGPQDYGRNHVDGANLLADALANYNGIVLWRAFVYSHDNNEDRAKQAYADFVPLDGQFRDNVVIQVKNGAIDFQPREPFHPMFGAMPNSNVGMEFQITQEYLGQGTHLVYLAPLFKECLESDTYAKGKGAEVAKVIDGSLFESNVSCISGVANIGTDRNWTGHHFGQANWYAYGRLAWNHNLSSSEISEEWLKMTFTNNEEFVKDISSLMLDSRDICVNYMTPYGLHHIMGRGHHYGPGPWVDGGRADWTSVYYHQADEKGIGFDRTETGSNALSQYYPKASEAWSDPSICPEKELLWFHHLSWDHKMKSGNSLWTDICYAYYDGAGSVKKMALSWSKYKDIVDEQRFKHVTNFLQIQNKDAEMWRDACVLYFQSKSGLAIPENLKKPEKNLEYFQNLSFPYAPGIKPQW